MLILQFIVSFLRMESFHIKTIRTASLMVALPADCFNYYICVNGRKGSYIAKGNPTWAQTWVETSAKDQQEDKCTHQENLIRTQNWPHEQRWAEGNNWSWKTNTQRWLMSMAHKSKSYGNNKLRVLVQVPLVNLNVSKKALRELKLWKASLSSSFLSDMQ